jgi:RNA polymerase sigma-70 factor (ECF subfamily)
MRNSFTTDADRFLALLEPLERDLERYSRRLIWEPQEAPDALQNAVLRAFAAFDRYHEDASFRAWIFRILTNEVFALNRKHARIARHEFQLEPEELEGLVGTALDGADGEAMPTPEVLAERMEPELAAALKTLTDAERAVLLLRALGELRYRDIAESLDMPLGSVMGHLARARLKTRLALARHQTTHDSSKVSPP